MEGLWRIHRPRNGEAKCRKLEADHDDGDDADGDSGRTWVYPDQRRKDEEDDALNGCQRRTAKHLPQYDRRAANGCSKHREQKSLVAVLNERHHAEDRREEDDHHYGAWEEVSEILI